MNWKNAILKYPGLEQLSKWKIRWKDLVNKGTESFGPKVLHDALSEWVDGVKFPKNGNEILKLKNKGTCFTRCIKTKKPTGHYEIALQVFLQEMNDSCCAQYTLLGNAENWDIVNVSRENLAEFIELKEWNSNDCPLYALVEALKNLVLFRHVSNSGQYETPPFKPELVSILAPITYYEDNGIVDAQKSHVRERLNPFIEACESQFDIDISFKAIDLSKSDFDEMCSKAKLADNQQNLRDNKRERATVENIKFVCPELLIENWKLIL
jgi:hypothetical protein